MSVYTREDLREHLKGISKQMIQQRQKQEELNRENSSSSSNSSDSDSSDSDSSSSSSSSEMSGLFAFVSQPLVMGLK